MMKDGGNMGSGLEATLEVSCLRDNGPALLFFAPGQYVIGRLNLVKKRAHLA